MKVKYNFKNIMSLQQEAKLALVDTAEIAKTDLIQSQTMPFDTGTMQNDSTFGEEGTSIDTRKVNKGRVYILSDTKYARKMYFHPEFNFNKDKNPNAGGRWFDPYITGDKKEWLIKAYAKALKRRVK